MGNTFKEEFIEHVRSQSDIVSVINDYVTLKRKGRNYWGSCPFHGEKTPSFSVNPEKQFFYCFGCGAGGNVFNFISKQEGLSFVEAVKKLAQRAGIPIPEEEKSPQERQREQERSEQLAVLKYAAALFHGSLVKSAAAETAREYLKSRGILPQTIEKFQLGYAPAEWDALYRQLQRKGVSPPIIEKTGLCLPRTKGAGYYDRFRSRIMFPIHNTQGTVIGFGGRVLDDTQPKYLNSPETALFNKRHQLYGLCFAGPAIKQTGRVVVVEGYMDVITAHQQGVSEVVASLGTAFTAEQAKLLLKHTYNIYIGYDADAAGQNATLRGLGILSGLGANVSVLSVPEGKDPDEFIRKRGKEAFLALLENAQGLIPYYLAQAMAGEEINSPAGKANVLKQMFPLLAELKNEVEIDEYLRMIAGRINVDEAAMRRMWAKLMGKKLPLDHKTVILGKNSGDAAAEPKEASAATTAEQDLIRLMLEETTVIPLAMQENLLSMVNTESHRQIIDMIFAVFREQKNVTVQAVDMRLQEAACAVLSKILAEERGFDDRHKAAEGCIRYLRYNQRQQRIAVLEQIIKESELKGVTVANDILTEYLQLVRDSKLFTENA
ncbi:MAG: DNA primase [Bacillota bacterium]